MAVFILIDSVSGNDLLGRGWEGVTLAVFILVDSVYAVMISLGGGRRGYL